MVEYIEREAARQYYVIRDKNTGLYFRGKGVNRWGKHYNQATIYRVKGTAEHTIKEISWRGEQAEIVPIRIIETAADVVEGRRGEWIEENDLTHSCSECGHDATYTYDGTEICGVACPYCGAKMDGKGEGDNPSVSHTLDSSLYTREPDGVLPGYKERMLRTFLGESN